MGADDGEQEHEDEIVRCGAAVRSTREFFGVTGDGCSRERRVDPLGDESAVWLEGEKPAAINVKPLIAGWGNKQFLSGEQWLQVSIDADKVEKEMPEEGVLIQY